jgi:hypothetical protein
MTSTFQNAKPVIGATIQRPQQWTKMDGFINGFKPNDVNDLSKGGTAFIGTSREVKRAGGAVKENHTFFVKVWGNDAMMVSAMAAHNKTLKEQGQDTETFMVNFSSSIEHINAKQGETQYPMSLRGNTFAQVDPKTYKVMQTADNFAAQGQQEQIPA